jgi:hypothetical protein
MYGYVTAKYPLKPHGYHLWIIAADRKVDYQPHSDRVENYHYPRHLMLTRLALDRLIQKGPNFHPPFAASATRSQS